MNHTTELKTQINTKTLHMVLLTLLTLGIYLIIWLVKNSQIIGKTTQTILPSPTYILWIAICHAWMWGSYAFNLLMLLFYARYYFIPQGSEFLLMLSTFTCLITLLAYPILLIIWSFKAKKAIQEYVLQQLKIDMPLSNLYLVLFHLFYINYCINQIPEVVRKHEIIKGHVC